MVITKRLSLFDGSQSFASNNLEISDEVASEY